MTESMDDEYHLLGLALVAAQRVEFILYGLAAHAVHTPTAQKEKRFRKLTPETFLRGDPGELKATLGQLVEAFGDTFLIRTTDLVDFYKDRNLIVHDYFRLFKAEIKGVGRRTDAVAFLRDFLERAVCWEQVLRGLLTELKLAAAVKHRREAEVVLSESDQQDVQAYREHATRHLASGPVPDAS